LEALDDDLLRLVLFSLVYRPICFRGVKLAEIALVVVQAMRVLMDDIRRNSVEEGAVVRNNEDRRGPRLEVILQPYELSTRSHLVRRKRYAQASAFKSKLLLGSSSMRSYMHQHNQRSKERCEETVIEKVPHSHPA
jgi:hypothetical protein